MPAAAGSSLSARAGRWFAVLALMGGLAWFLWYGYEDGRVTARSIQVIGLLRDVQTCVGLSYAGYQRQLPPGAQFGAIPKMKATPYASRLDWDPRSYKATAVFADIHRDFDGRSLWIAARIDPNGALRWTCGTTVGEGARSYRNLGEFIERCERPLSVDLGVIDYCARFVPLPSREGSAD